MDPMILGWGLVWTLTTAFYSNYGNKLFLDVMQSGVAHNVTRYVGSAVVCMLLAHVFFFKHTRPHYDKLALFLPSGCCMVVMNIANSVALKGVGVTLTYVVKSTIPVWTCAYCYIFKGERYSLSVVLALTTSCVGVALASFGEVEFNWFGFGAACLSCCTQTMFNILSKDAVSKANAKCVKDMQDWKKTNGKDKGLTPPLGEFLPTQGFSTSMIVASIFSLIFYQFEEHIPGMQTHPVFGISLNNTALLFGDSAAPELGFFGNVSALVLDIVAIFCGAVGISSPIVRNGALERFWPMMVLIIAATSYLMEYCANFIYGSLVSSVAFSITDIVRRISTIGANAWIYNKELSLLNSSGIAISLGGALMYVAITSREGTAKSNKKAN
jgi:drug/metabolite transporter (DMT)-like permease